MGIAFPANLIILCLKSMTPFIGVRKLAGWYYQQVGFSIKFKLISSKSSCEVDFNISRLRVDRTDAQADLNLHWAHSHFVCFVLRRLISDIAAIGVILSWQRTTKARIRLRRCAGCVFAVRIWHKLVLSWHDSNVAVSDQTAWNIRLHWFIWFQNDEDVFGLIHNNVSDTKVITFPLSNVIL